MKCKKCNANINKKWNFCPSCHKMINKQNYFVIFIVIIFGIFTLFSIFDSIFYSVIQNNVKLREKSVILYLQWKYKEDFEQYYLVKSIENNDEPILCFVGECYGEKEGVGFSDYYKVFSEKNNIEFTAHYDTSKKINTVNDNYNLILSKRNSATQMFDKINKEFPKYIQNIYLTSDKRNIKATQVHSKEEVYSILSNTVEADLTLEEGITSYSIYVYINIDGLNFCKSEFNKIIDFNEYVIKNTNQLEYGIPTIYFITSDNIKIYFNEPIDNVLIKEQNQEKTLDEFITSY